jgi:antitoxin CptB
MSNATTNLDVDRRRLLWRAKHRGIKEMDLIVGGYAEANLPTMNATDLGVFAEILEIPDQLLLSWATNQEPVPQNQKSKMLDDILAFRPRLQP